MALAADDAGAWPGAAVGWAYRNLPGQHLVASAGEWATAAEHADVVMTFDCGSIDRLAELAPSVARSAQRGALIVVDHHLTNTRFGSINVVDDNAAASSVVVRELLDRLGWPLTRDSAWCLYAALATDTGRFQFSSTTAEVFMLAQISRELFEETPFAVLRLCGEVVASAELVPLDTVANEPGFRVAVATVSNEQLARFAVDVSDTEPLIDWVRRAAEADVAVVLKQTPGGDTRGSMRSLGRVDVSRVASALGGGGHRFAAGFTSANDVATVRAAVLDLVGREVGGRG
jgi:phosphoesterase RecJ-like protein